MEKKLGQLQLSIWGKSVIRKAGCAMRVLAAKENWIQVEYIQRIESLRHKLLDMPHDANG